MHGYELRRRIRTGLGPFWRVASSQLYSVLHRLEARGWVVSQEDEVDARAKRIYGITPRGQEAFEAWIGAPVEHLRDLRVELFAKLYFLRRRAPKGIARFVERQIAVLRRLETHLADRTGLGGDDPGLGRIGVSFRRHQLRSTTQWLAEHLEELQETEERS